MGVDEVILQLLGRAPQGRSISPEEVARAMDGEGWRRQLSRVRGGAVEMARQRRLEIIRQGRPADPDAFKGVWRMRLPQPDETRRG